jgi:putative flavoprotein involved in K+ transport
MQDQHQPERFDVVVVGAGQAGLAAGYELSRRDLRFMIVDAGERIGDPWRRRWDGLRLFTPARYDGLPGMPFPAPPSSFPTKDDVADYLESYAGAMHLPVRTGMRVESVRHEELADAFVISAGGRRMLADQVVIATGAYHAPNIPGFANDLDPGILQLHSSEYQTASQLRPGPVAIVGASNSGAEIAMTAARSHRVILAGRDTGKMPVRPESRLARIFDIPFWFFINRVLRADSALGRRALPLVRDQGGPLERVWPEDLTAAGVERIFARVDGVERGKPRLDDGRVLDVANVVWCTGFRPAYDWIELPLATDDSGWPLHRRGVVERVPGLYFIGLPFLYTAASALIGGVGRDAAHLAGEIDRRARATLRRSAADAAIAPGADPAPTI